MKRRNTLILVFWAVLLLIISVFISACSEPTVQDEGADDSSLKESAGTSVESQNTREENGSLNMVDQDGTNTELNESQQLSINDDAINTSVNNTLNKTINATEQINYTGMISGSLDLQPILELCPSIQTSFACDRYDPRRCDFARLIGAEGYWPDYLSCRAGNAAKGENPENRYCLIQKCKPLPENNIAKTFGGTAVYAEYQYSEDKTDGLMTHYTLLRCGQMHMEFDSEFDCVTYKAELWH